MQARPTLHCIAWLSPSSRAPSRPALPFHSHCFPTVAAGAAIKVQWKHMQKCETVLQSADDPQKFEKCAMAFV